MTLRITAAEFADEIGAIGKHLVESRYDLAKQRLETLRDRTANMPGVNAMLGMLIDTVSDPIKRRDRAIEAWVIATLFGMMSVIRDISSGEIRDIVKSKSKKKRR